MLIHVQTIVQTVFGNLDQDRNIIKKQPLSFEIAKFDQENFIQAVTALKDAKEKVESQSGEKIVHVNSVVNSLFGSIDEEDNVVGKSPVSYEISKLSEESFIEAFVALKEARNK